MAPRTKSVSDFVETIQSGKEGGAWFRSQVKEKGLDWFLDTYAKHSGLPRNTFSHAADGKVAEALQKQAGKSVRVSETLIRSFRLEHNFKTFSRQPLSPGVGGMAMIPGGATFPTTPGADTSLEGVIRTIVRQEIAAYFARMTNPT